MCVGGVTDFAVGRGALVPNICVSEVSKSVAACSVHFMGPGAPPCLPGPIVRAVRRLFTACTHGDGFTSGMVCFKPVKYEANFCFLIHSVSGRSTLRLVGSAVGRYTRRGKRVPKAATVRYKGCLRRSLSNTLGRLGGCCSLLGSCAISGLRCGWCERLLFGLPYFLWPCPLSCCWL